MKKLSILFLVCVVLITSCSLPAIEKESPEINTVEEGKRFRVNLPEDHTTGYTWILNHDFDDSKIENINTVWRGNENGIDFNFRALSAGQTTLTLVKRKFTDTSDIKQFIVQIKSK